METPPIRLAASSFTEVDPALYSSSLYTRRVPKGFSPVDFDLSENLVELEETKTGKRYWTPLRLIFGKIVDEPCIIMRQDNGHEQELILWDVKPLQFGNYNYLQLIFGAVSYGLPF